MQLPVSTESFWKDRLERAKRENKLHYAVYLTRQDLWDSIAVAHQKILKREVEPTYKVLDAGCGYGRASEWITNYTGVDSSPDLLRKASELYPDKKFIKADLKNLPFKNNHFDVAFCISIKQMIRANLGEGEWQRIEDELKRVAKKVLILEYEDSDNYFIL